MATKKKSPPRNAYVQAMTLRHKKQIFRHKAEDQGGDTNVQKELKSEADDALCFSCEKEKQKYTTGLCQSCHEEAMAASEDEEDE